MDSRSWCHIITCRKSGRASDQATFFSPSSSVQCWRRSFPPLFTVRCFCFSFFPLCRLSMSSSRSDRSPLTSLINTVFFHLQNCLSLSLSLWKLQVVVCLSPWRLLSGGGGSEESSSFRNNWNLSVWHRPVFSTDLMGTLTEAPDRRD